MATEKSLNQNLDLEDLLQCFCAKKYKCILITNDKKFANCDIEIINYDRFLQKEIK